MKQIYAFDFDGTLTTRDTLLVFTRYAKGTRAFLWGFLRHAHLLVLMKLRLYPNWKAKQRVFSYFFTMPSGRINGCWLSHLESNQNSGYQKPVCSRYTMGQRKVMILYHNLHRTC